MLDECRSSLTLRRKVALHFSTDGKKVNEQQCVTMGNSIKIGFEYEHYSIHDTFLVIGQYNRKLDTVHVTVQADSSKYCRHTPRIKDGCCEGVGHMLCLSEPY